jgi:hypothetical protein
MTVRAVGSVTGVSPTITPRSALQNIVLSPTSASRPIERAPRTTCAVICSPDGRGASGRVGR